MRTLSTVSPDMDDEFGIVLFGHANLLMSSGDDFRVDEHNLKLSYIRSISFKRTQSGAQMFKITHPFYLRARRRVPRRRLSEIDSWDIDYDGKKQAI